MWLKNFLILWKRVITPKPHEIGINALIVAIKIFVFRLLFEILVAPFSKENGVYFKNYLIIKGFFY